MKTWHFFTLMLVSLVVVPLLIFQPGPKKDCIRIENVEPLNETFWYDSSGAECGHAWQEPFGWYAFHTHGFEFGKVFPTKELAYKNVEGYCRVKTK